MKTKYNYPLIKTQIEIYLKNHKDEYFYAKDIADALGYSTYVVTNALKTIKTTQVMDYRSKNLVYLTKDGKEKQVPESFVNKFIENGWVAGRCEASKRAICIAAGGDPDRIPLIWIHKGSENKQINKNELDSWLIEGWEKGKLNLSTLGKVAIHKDNVDKFVKPEEVQQYIEQGWLKGGKEKRNLRDYSNVWNKNKTKETDPRLLSVSEKTRANMLNMSQEERDKISRSVKKLWQDEEYRRNHTEKLKGRPAWNKGITGIYHWSEEQRRKHDETKHKNNTFNKSKPEEDYYLYLVEKYGEKDVVRQYKESRYPFHCDFYIPSEDLFIELNAHWTHGEEPYDPQNSKHQKLLNVMCDKAAKSEFYNVAIKIWTELDVRKRETAIKNQLNYEVIYGTNSNYRCYRISHGELHRVQ